jgi:hypothetical protein
MKYATNRPYSDPEKAARRLMEHAQAFEPIQEGRIYIEKMNGPFLFGDKGTPAEYTNVKLEAFGVIAKEGRKYGLTCVLATQRPRDIPADVLSQLGTLIVHRLTNDEDRQAVERACGDLDRNAALFIPTLAPGEAIVIGPDLPAPVPININPPAVPPNSRGPNYEKYWRNRKAQSESA